MAAKTRWEAIEELLKPMIADGSVNPSKSQEALDALLAREKSISTGIGFGVGIPHAPTTAVAQLALAVGLSSAGIQFDALDGKPVHVVVLILVPAPQHQEHLKTLATISRLLHQKGFRKALEKAKTAEDIFKVFSSADK
jgi:mannitol/fructose-specific phosphotransferase system IIA component (Ntr-type)